MNSTISEIQEVAQGNAEWTIKNWNTDLDFLKDYANCKLEINRPEFSAPVKFRFYLAPYVDKDNSTHHGPIDKCLSLNAHVDFKGHTPMLVSIDLLTNTTNPANLLGMRFGVGKDGKDVANVVIQKKFIYLTSYKYELQNSAWKLKNKEELPQPDVLQFIITATIFNFNMRQCLETDEGANGVDRLAVEASITRDLKLMNDAEDNYSDLKLETKDNMTLTGHRFILAARSPVFRKIIDQHLKQNGFNGAIKMCTVNAKPLHVVLDWMYSGELNENAANVMEEVVEICVAFEIPDLLRILDKKLITVCTTQNMFQLFQIAQKNGMTFGMGAITTFIKENIDKVAPLLVNQKLCIGPKD